MISNDFIGNFEEAENFFWGAQLDIYFEIQKLFLRSVQLDGKKKDRIRSIFKSEY